jgi:YARHG domain-containing protein
MAPGRLRCTRNDDATLSDGKCFRLWEERNSYYKDAGHCFKTARAITYFGKAGCQYDTEACLSLSRGVRARIAEIVRLEAQYGCS